MAYYTRLQTSMFFDHMSEQLKEHIDAPKLHDASITYIPPNIIDKNIGYKKKENFKSKPTDVRLPARLNSPLIPYPQQILDLINGNFNEDKDLIHGHHFSQLNTLSIVFNDLQKEQKIPMGEFRFRMDDLKRFARQSYSKRENLINLATRAFAARATKHDLSIAANQRIPSAQSHTNTSTYTSLIIMIQRLRVHIAKQSHFPRYDPATYNSTSEEASYTMFDNGVYIYQLAIGFSQFCLIACGGHFRFYHSNLGYWFCGPTSYLDYVFTIADILNNLDVIKNCEEYYWATDMLNLMIEFAEHEGYHDDQVDFMKTLEGFFLNMSDYDESFAMNWKPILEAVEELWTLDKRISSVEYDMGLPLALLRGLSFKYPKQSFFCRFIALGKKLDRTHLQEISALHKLIFYAEVDGKAGVNKFLERVHTPRRIDKNAVKNLTRLAKSQFLISYRKRHNLLPNVIGPTEKIKMLEAYSQKSTMSQIESLPLSWWDEIKIFDCMDNTMTDDPLEFAKDKGALKSRISFGPGDSRKELLQVLETEKYELKDFFSARQIVPKTPMVYRTSQLHEAIDMKDPARLIEKEREQKRKARLFANGELSNKHSLSLVAARMKKALSYFDEQLMTPTDRKRKALIHEASRELSQNDNYSLLLDIEGHNQSMQHENTHELTEFIGNLFGFDGWGDLGHYFGQLTVYHYDEYLDDVTESHGQLGGIEGWLNPLWTLHTTLMMKLLRIMTDIDVKTIMVYSDDVNAIVKIPQASEPMVQSVFSKIMKHCTKFGMTIKYSQTNLSKHRVTMLRQHYADGIRADSTLKRLISISAGNNPVIVADELEVAGICSSSSSAMELSNHHETCSYLKNYKLGLLLCRLPQMILSRQHTHSMISSEELPAKLSNLLYYSKQDKEQLNLLTRSDLMVAAKNDIAAYLNRRSTQLRQSTFEEAIQGSYGIGVAESRLVDSPDRVLYLQIYDTFIQDLLFFWTYLPTSLGGLGGSLHLNLMLSGHSIGLSKALHYLHMWIVAYSSDKSYFSRYLSTTLSVKMDEDRNVQEVRLVNSTWPSDSRICPVTTSVQQSIKSMVRRTTKNEKVLELFSLSDDRDVLASELLSLFRGNFHSRIVQFYHENTSIHFIDLLVSKVETSSGLLCKVRNITKLRNSLSSRVLENIRLAADTSRTYFFEVTDNTDIVQSLLDRKISMFPNVKMIEVEELLYDDKIQEVDHYSALLTVRRCAPTHYRNGIKVFDDPKVGNETLYKGELLDNDRMLGNKEELLAAKLVAVTKWFLMKHNLLSSSSDVISKIDVVKACNLSLKTLTGQTFADLFAYAPTETGGEILHRIPNIRFSTATYIRSEMNRSLNYTTELNQRLITSMGLVDSNVNFDYLRMRFLVSAIVTDKYDTTRRLVVRYGFRKLTGIKDVQFVKPLATDYIVKAAVKCYSDIRNHKLSIMRFRYLSHSYLYEENVNEWALMPKISEACTAEEVGKNYVNDLILRYARDLDKDYMLISPEMIDAGVWVPLIKKLYAIDKNWKMESTNTDEEELRERLKFVMMQRSRMSILDPSNKLFLSLQTQCLDTIKELSPSDVEYYSLIKRFSTITQNRRFSKRLSIKLSQYQSMLSMFEDHRRNLAKSLIFEYVLTFHFKVARSGQDYYVDVDAAMTEFLSSGLAKLSFLIVNPDLQVQLMILGFEYVDQLISTSAGLITDELRDICADISCADIIVPEKLPSIESYTNLTGNEEIPDYLNEIEYALEDIPLSAMASFNEAKALFEYAHICSTTGASPVVFSSHTGSDSMGAQYSLVRTLLDSGIIDHSMKICDLTAGRGDGLYAFSYHGLIADSYSKSDTFTRINHHPDIIFKSDYDVFNGATLKFITDYDFVHVDISFTGNAKEDISDLIFLLEESNITYSIRVNSISIGVYNNTTTAHLPSYDHKLAYSVNNNMKPYQVYLIGVPTDRAPVWHGPEMKDTVAFRSLALSYAHLFNPKNRHLRLHSYQPNSASIYLPKGTVSDEFLKKICSDSISSEQLYFLQRYMAEVGADRLIEYDPKFMESSTLTFLNKHIGNSFVTYESSYGILQPEQIGNVSERSYPYHLRHINALNENDHPRICVKLIDADETVLSHFRTHHPVSEVRSWCNVAIGLSKFCRRELLSGHADLERLYSTLKSKNKSKQSQHQREISLAIKLLVLAARDDNFAYGVNFCYSLSSESKRSPKNLMRTLRIYRLLSYLFIDLQRLMSRGEICIRSIDAIASEIEVREKQRYKYRRSTEIVSKDEELTKTMDAIITNSIDSLIQSLTEYSNKLANVNLELQHGSTLDDIMTTEGITFDLDVAGHVEMMIKRLDLKPSGPHGFIDLGDEDILEYDEW